MWARPDGERVLLAPSAAAADLISSVDPVDPSCRFGFSEPPTRPSITAVRPLLEFP